MKSKSMTTIRDVKDHAALQALQSVSFRTLVMVVLFELIACGVVFYFYYWVVPGRVEALLAGRLPSGVTNALMELWRSGVRVLGIVGIGVSISCGVWLVWMAWRAKQLVRLVGEVVDGVELQRNSNG